MTTWDDKPNDYEHALAEIERLRAAIFEVRCCGMSEKNVNDIFPEGLQAALDRKDFVCAHVPHCPRCGEQMQIQIKDYFSVPAHWRCRMCKYHFDHEPRASVRAHFARKATMNDNDDTFRSGAQLLAEWGCKTREKKLKRACMALMEQLNGLHVKYENQDLGAHLSDENIACSCADAYRMGHEALK
jgi:transposase-like protein